MLGWVCAYTPEEVFAALGIRSYRLCGEGRQETALRHLPVNLCPLARACLSEGGMNGAGTGDPLTGMVTPTSCHALVHLANAFQHTRGGNGQFFVHLLDLPRTFGRENEAACRAFAASLRDLAGRLSKFYGVAWDDGAFLTAIEQQQQVRLLLQEIYRMRREQPGQFRAAGLLELVRAAGRARKEELVPVLRGLVASLRDANLEQKSDAGSRMPDILQEADCQMESNYGLNASASQRPRLMQQSGSCTGVSPEGNRIGSSRESQDGQALDLYLKSLRRRGSPRGPRLLVTGSPLPPVYLDLIEDLGGNVAGDDLCQGYRYCLPNVEEGLAGGGGNGRDLFLAVARGYLRRPACPRMLAGPERFAYLQALIRECRAQGVVYHALKFCDSSLYDYALLRNRFVEAGVPVLYLETEYREAGLEQARTRIQAFLELLDPIELQKLEARGRLLASDV